MQNIPIIRQIAAAEECVWINPDKRNADHAFDGIALTMADIEDAEARLARFAPFIMECFPETAANGGIIESPLTPITQMRDWLNENADTQIVGQLLLKRDSDLDIAGSVKARGGIYEVLKHTEDIALELKILHGYDDDYTKLASEESRKLFSQYKIQVGSTGNLGLSIGIMSAMIGYQVIVHMSADAKQWKKDLLRSKGVTVTEYQSNYSEAVKQGRKRSMADPQSYFVDDENSVDLFLGYAVAAKRLRTQLEQQHIQVDNRHPLFVYIPCGVGGAPGGIAFGLKQLFGDAVHIFFVEPTQAPCMLLGMVSKLNNAICVQDVGLSGLTHADGLAVGRPSGFVGGVMKHILSGEMTLDDARLYDYMRALLHTENIFIEPSACAAFIGPIRIFSKIGKPYLAENCLEDVIKNAVHIVWATGGKLVPEKIREEYMRTNLNKEQIC